MTADVQRELAAVLDDTATGLWMAQSGPGWGDTIAAALLPAVQALIADAEKRAAAGAVEQFERLFAGGPDTACRTTWRPEAGALARGQVALSLTECVEVPMDDLRAAFDAAAALDPSGAAEGPGR